MNVINDDAVSKQSQGKFIGLDMRKFERMSNVIYINRFNYILCTKFSNLVLPGHADYYRI